ncbi:hypothetical protein NW762_004261 [Fusarium torreyae]|uniref:Ketoreductase (KR) domain-containing protein n=1 Tax=Fusarium torreyae TaxID=1237075 RepID=A0A9W8S5P7_9HYPO|nr:hypothetical protein NW762_004261 [Fusarium torreyae]
MLLRDAIFEQMVLDDWRSGLRPKLYGTWSLHTELSATNVARLFRHAIVCLGRGRSAWHGYQPRLISDVGYVSASSKVAERLRKDGDFPRPDEDLILRALKAAILHPLGARYQIIVGFNSSLSP